MSGAALARAATSPTGGGEEPVYLYAVLEGTSPPAVDAGAWAPGELELVAGGGLVVAAAPVPAIVADAARALEQTGGGTAEHAAGGLDVLGDAVRAHEVAVERLFARNALLPLRFGTVARRRADVVRLLEQHADDLRAQLRRVKGRREWGVKLSWAAEVARSRAAGSADEPDVTAGGPGRAYLAARRRERAEATGLVAACEACGGAIEEALAVWSEAKCRVGFLGEDDLAAPSPARPGPPPSVRVLDGAFLVAERDERLFFTALEEAVAREEGLTATVSGPWPPYSFVQPLEVDT